MPSARANTFAEPPGSTPTAGADPLGPATPRIPLTTSFTVPSPPWTISTSRLSRTASRAISMECPRWSVCVTVSFTRLSNAWASRSRPAAVVDVALGFTINTARTESEPIRRIGRLAVSSARGLIDRVPLVHPVLAGPPLNQSLPPQVGQMCERLSHCQIPLKLQEGIGDLNFRDLTDGAGVAADHGVDRVEPALFVARDRIDSAPAVGECAAVSRHHQRRVALGDELERCQIAAEGIPVESALECDWWSDGG